MSNFFDFFSSSSIGILAILILIWHLILYIALCAIILYGAIVLKAKYEIYKEESMKDLANVVKCLMTTGVFYDSTTSAEPLYEGESPTLSLDSDYDFKFNKFCKMLEKEGYLIWLKDLKLKKREYLNKED